MTYIIQVFIPHIIITDNNFLKPKGYARHPFSHRIRVIHAPPPCKECGHPYDHNGKPHSSAFADLTRRGGGPTRNGELLTGPNGLPYRWNYPKGWWIPQWEQT